ncbi:MAG: hypothetical protein AAB116_02750 [Candidatus Poribacteria bacterium]
MFTDMKTQTLNLSKDYKHVYLDENENPCVANVEIRQIAEDENIHKWSVRKIKKMYHLTFAQVHSALAFYFDSEEEENRAMDYGREWQRNMKSVDGYKYVAINEDGIPIIKPTKMKIEYIVVERGSYRWGPKMQQEQHPFLILSQVHSALSYYFDHKAEIDGDIEEGERYVEEMMRVFGQNPIAEKLKAMKEARCR